MNGTRNHDASGSGISTGTDVLGLQASGLCMLDTSRSSTNAVDPLGREGSGLTTLSSPAERLDALPAPDQLLLPAALSVMIGGYDWSGYGSFE